MIEISLRFTGNPQRSFQLFHARVERQVLARSAGELARTTRRVVLRNVPVRTGFLRDSVGIFDVSDTEKIVFTDTDYSRVVEFGYTGIQIVKPHERLQTVVYGRPITPITVSVRGHTRFVDRRARPHMRPAFEHAKQRAIPILRRNLNL